MILKKNPKYDLEKKRTYFIQLGLVLSLLFIIIAFEWKTYDQSLSDLGSLESLELEEEIIPLTEKELKPPPPPPPPPPKITIVEDDIIIEEELDIEEADTDEEEIIEIFEEEEEEEVVLFSIVENPPLFPDCSRSASREEQQQCFQMGVMKHIQSNFKYPEIPKAMGISERIIVNFYVSIEGKITNVQVVRGDDKHLREEAERLVKSIPKLTPAKQRGQPTAISFTVPISFTLR